MAMDINPRILNLQALIKQFELNNSSDSSTPIVKFIIKQALLSLFISPNISSREEYSHPLPQCYKGCKTTSIQITKPYILSLRPALFIPS